MKIEIVIPTIETSLLRRRGWNLCGPAREWEGEDQDAEILFPLSSCDGRVRVRTSGIM